jgi:hypothetical protein
MSFVLEQISAIRTCVFLSNAMLIASRIKDVDRSSCQWWRCGLSANVSELIDQVQANYDFFKYSLFTPVDYKVSSVFV